MLKRGIAGLSIGILFLIVGWLLSGGSEAVKGSFLVSSGVLITLSGIVVISFNISSDLKKENNDKITDSRTERSCIECGVPIGPTDEYCWNCGTKNSSY